MEGEELEERGIWGWNLITGPCLPLEHVVVYVVVGVSGCLVASSLFGWLSGWLVGRPFCHLPPASPALWSWECCVPFAAWLPYSSRALPSSGLFIMIDIVCPAQGVGRLFPASRSWWCLVHSALGCTRRCRWPPSTRALPSTFLVMVVNIVEPACMVSLLFPARWQRG